MLTRLYAGKSDPIDPEQEVHERSPGRENADMSYAKVHKCGGGPVAIGFDGKIWCL